MDVMRRIEEVMIPVDQYPSVRDSSTLKEAVEVIENAQLEVAFRKSLPRAILVFDGIGVMVGTVRRRDIMRGLEPKYLLAKPLTYRKKLFDIEVDPNLSDLSGDHLVEGIRDQGSRPVSDVMRPIETMLKADDLVMRAAQEMVARDVNLIPVLKDRHLVGVVRSVDVFQDLAQILI